MYIRYSISICILFCFLFVAVGCDRQSGGDVIPPQTSAPSALPTSKTTDLDTHFGQLQRKRLEFQEKIFEAMELYRTTSQKIREQRTQLKQYLGDKSVSEAIELFSKERSNDVPPNLRAAYSCWRTLIPDETQRLQIAVWIDKQQASGVLEELDIQIKEFENRRQLGKILDQNELAEIDRLLARPVVGWETVDASDRALLEEEAIEKLKSDLANWE